MTEKEAIEIITNAIQTQNLTVERDKALAIIQKAMKCCEPFEVRDIVRQQQETINRQQAEIERLEKVQVQYVKAYFNEFVERLKNDFRLAQLDIGLTSAVVDELAETMSSELNTLADFTDLIKVEAYKEFAERLKEKAHRCDLSTDEHEYYSVGTFDIDNLVKEMEGAGK